MTTDELIQALHQMPPDTVVMTGTPNADYDWAEWKERHVTSYLVLNGRVWLS